jgi:uncharacterized membrane protein/protein-disulfide isomerase
MTARTRLLILSLALLGLVFSAWAGLVHYRLLTQPNYISPCDINATFNCSELYLSQYGSVGGVSVALLGGLFFLVVGAIAGFSKTTPDKSQHAATSYVFVLSTIGLAVVLYLGWASYFVLHKLCALCLGTYGAVIGLFIVSGIGSPYPVTRLPRRLASDVSGVVSQPARLFASLALVVVAVSMIGCFPREGTTPATGAGAATSSPASGAAGGSARADFETAWAAQQRTDLGIPADGAKVIVVKFNDYQCPSCKSAHYAYKAVLDKYAQEMPGVVKYVVKDYPLHPRCNFSPGMGPIHPAACEASAAVRMAAERGKEKENEMIEWVFTNQSTLTAQSVEGAARTILGVTDFSAQYARVLPDIKRDVADGISVQVDVTPTYYVNGVKAMTPTKAWLAPEYFDWAIQYEIKKAGGQ